MAFSMSARLMRSPYASISAALRAFWSRRSAASAAAAAAVLLVVLVVLVAGLGEPCRGDSCVVLRTPNKTSEAAGRMSFPARLPALGRLGVVVGLDVWNWGGAGYTRAAVEKWRGG